MNPILCERLRDLRLYDKYTQLEVAARIDVSRSTYGAYERGTIDPPAEKIQALARLYHVNVDYLLGNSDDRFRDERKALDVTHQLHGLMRALKDINADLTLDGVVLDLEERRSLVLSLENGLRFARMLQDRGHKDD